MRIMKDCPGPPNQVWAHPNVGVSPGCEKRWIYVFLMGISMKVNAADEAWIQTWFANTNFYTDNPLRYPHICLWAATLSKNITVLMYIKFWINSTGSLSTGKGGGFILSRDRDISLVLGQMSMLTATLL